MADLLILDDADQPIAAPIAIGPLAPGQQSAAVTLHVWWAQGEPLEPSQSEGALVGLARLAGSTDPFRGDSTRMQVTGGLEMRVTGGAWIALRAGTALRLPVIPADSFVAVELRVTSPIGAGAALDVEVLVEPHVLRSTAWSPDVLRGVILSGLGDRRRSGIYSQGGDVVAQSPETDTVETPVVSWLALGAAYSLTADAFTPSATDANGDPLAAGEGYVSALTLGVGAYVEVKGVKGTLPLDVLDRPAVPANTPVLAWIVRDDTATIADIDIDQGPGAGFFHATASGLTVTVNPDGPGSALGGRHVLYRTPQPLTMTPSVVETIYLLPDHSLERVAAGAQPTDPLAIPIWRATMDGAGVTDLVDLRRWYPDPDVIRFEFPANLTVGADAYAMAPRDLDVLPVLGQAALALLDNPGTSGSTDVTIEQSVPGSGAWSTVAALSIAFDVSPALATAEPIATSIPAGNILRAVVTGQTLVATPSSGAAALVCR